MARGRVNLVPAERGNDLAVKHGCYALLRLRGRAEEIRQALEEIVPMPSPADGPMLDTLAVLLSQLERAQIVLSAIQLEETEAIHDGRRVPKELRSDLARLSQDARGWANSAARLADRMGLTAAGRAQLGWDVVRAESALQALIEEGRRVRERAGS
jgi:hypothetical protein